MLETCGWDDAAKETLWNRWLKVADKRVRNLAVAEPASTVPVQLSSAVTASVSKSHPWSSPVCYRGHRFRLLRYMRQLLRLHREQDNVHQWLHEVRCRVNDRRSFFWSSLHCKSRKLV